MKKYAVMFPGQGVQYSGMGQEMYKQYKVARETFDFASDVVGFDIAELCFGINSKKIFDNQNIQPALLTFGVASYKVLMQQVDFPPTFLLGHSLGEITALVCSGAIEFKDALKLTKLREKLMCVSLGKLGSMIAVMGLDIIELQKICDDISNSEQIIEIANYNSDEQIVLSGHTTAIELATKQIEELGGYVFQLNTANPFHCSLMLPTVSSLKELLSSFQYRDFTVPVISNMTAEPYKGKHTIIETLSNQIINNVKWKQSIDYIAKQNVFIAIEVGPQSVLRNLLMSNEQKIQAYSLDDKKDRKFIKEVTMNLCNCMRTDNKAKIEFLKKCLCAFVTMRNNSDNIKDYSEKVIACYVHVDKLINDIIEESREVSFEEMKHVLDALVYSMKAKEISLEEQNDRLKYILYSTGFFDVFYEYVDGG